MDPYGQAVPESAALTGLLVALAVKQHGAGEWPAVAETVRPLAEKLGCRLRSADEYRVLFAALPDVKEATAAAAASADPTTPAVDGALARLRARRIAELRAEVRSFEAQAERLKRDLAAVEAGERDDIAMLLATLPPAFPPQPPAADGPPSKATMAQLLKILNSISKHKWAYPFKRPVTDKEAPDYKDIIKQPMDFSTIRKRVELGYVRTLDELRADLQLVFSNAMVYNAKGSDYFKMAESLHDHARHEFERLLAEAANASHLSPEATELLREAGVGATNLNSAAGATRLRSSQPTEPPSAAVAHAHAPHAPASPTLAPAPSAVAAADADADAAGDVESGGVADEGAVGSPAAPEADAADGRALSAVKAEADPAATTPLPAVSSSRKRALAATSAADSAGGSARARSRR